MITQWLMNLMAGFAHTLFNLCPGVPSWVTSAVGYVSDLWGWIYDFNGWFPVTEMAITLPIVLAFYVSMIGVRATRIVVSHFTGGGGAVS